MKRRKVIMDVDGVLANFTGRVLSIVNGECSTRYTPRDVRTWEIFDSLAVGPHVRDMVYDLMRGPGACSSIAPYEGAKEGFGKLREVADVIVATCPFAGSRWWTFDREEWLERHFGVPKTLVHHVHDKRHVHGDALVDDNPKHLAAWDAYWRERPIAGACSHFTVHWTGHGTSLPPDPAAGYRIGDWDALVETVRWK